MLKRLIESGSNISVLFVDHNRSFKRLVRSLGGSYLEPEDFSELESSLSGLLSSLGQAQTLHGVELSELKFKDKERAFRLLLEEIETYLRKRKSLHPVYVVLDECWQFMQKEPELVQRAFREFRKLNGAAVAITQSIGDLVQDSSGSGQAIIQNAPICVLLRQGEDLSAHKNRLGMNDTETALVRFLQQRKGEFSECLIKMPFQSKLGRLHPTPEEHALLRTDNLREELVREREVLRA
jgi:type IV secretory pathway VirB4 component